MDLDRLRRMARPQGGLFTRAQARDCGFTVYQIRRRVAAGEWLELQHGVLAFEGLSRTRAVADRAAQLAVPGSVLAVASAALVWRMEVPDERRYLAVPGRTTRQPDGVIILRESVVGDTVTLRGGAEVTSRSRTVFDCLRFLPDQAALDLGDQALQRGWITGPGLCWRMTGFAGRAGAPRMLGIVRRLVGGSRFAAERLAARILRDAGVSGWAANAAICDEAGIIGVGDVVFEAVRLVVELDGMAYHVSAQAFQRDRQRQNRLVAAGWTVLRFTWRDLTERPQAVVREIVAMLARLSRA